MKTNSTALLVMDIQDEMIGMVQDQKTYLDSLNKAIDHARKNNLPVIYIVLGYRKGFTDMSPNNMSYARITSSSSSLDKPEGAKVHSAIAVQPNDFYVVKKRFSAFSGSDLEVVLRSLGVNHIVLTGLSTSGVVLSTLREAADKDYQITILSDGCADRDEEVHRVLTTKVFPRQATVLTIDEWLNK